MIIGGIGLHLEVVSHQVFSDPERRLVELFVAHHWTDLLLRKECGVTQSQTPMFRQHVAGLHIDTLAGEDGRLRCCVKQWIRAGSSHEIGSEGKTSVFEDQVGEVAL